MAAPAKQRSGYTRLAFNLETQTSPMSDSPNRSPDSSNAAGAQPATKAQNASRDASTLSLQDLLEALFRERKRDRRAGVIKAVLLVLALVTYGAGWLFMMGWGLGHGPALPDEPYASVVRIEGAIGPDMGASYARLVPVLRQAFEAPGTTGVVLDINSPGGTPVQSSLIHDLILDLKTKHNLPVIAVGSDLMASGAYFIASAADYIVANRSTVAGSIGVISAGFGFTGLMDKLGVERRVTTAGVSKSLMDPFRPITPSQEAKQRELLADIHEHFKEVVIAGRGERLKLDTPGLFEGVVWTGEKALAVGLVDSLGDVDSAAHGYLGVEKTHRFDRAKTLSEYIGSVMSLKVMEQVQAALVSAPLMVYR